MSPSAVRRHRGRRAQSARRPEGCHQKSVDSLDSSSSYQGNKPYNDYLSLINYPYHFVNKFSQKIQKKNKQDVREAYAYFFLEQESNPVIVLV